MVVTICIFVFRLYPHIPNISIVYLLVVIGLACIRGRYAAIAASIIAFLSFDYFIVPPLFTLVMPTQEWIALFVFLIAALLTGQLAALLRLQVEAASRRERETYHLYRLLSLVNREEQPEKQLQVVMQAVVEVFSSWGVHDCLLLRSDATDLLHIEASAYQPVEATTLSSDERALALGVMTHGRSKSYISLRCSSSRPLLEKEGVSVTPPDQVVEHTIRFLPLKIGKQVIGVLRLCSCDEPNRLVKQGIFADRSASSHGQPSFFWTFLDQVTSLIEQVYLRRENQHIEMLQRTDALRAALLSSVSHDLRTPLTAIKAAASSMLQDGVQWDEEAQNGFASLIEREADRLNRLVGNLLDLSRIEEGALRLDKDWYQLAEMLHEVLDRLQPLLRGRTIQIIVSEALPLLFVDYMAFDQVFTNLLENIVRYTPPLSPIDIRAEQDGKQVLIRLADRGPGIPYDEQAYIFDKFYRVLHQPTTGESVPPGTGLGLALCRGLIEAHQGHIWVENRPEGGTVFCLVLPITSQEIPS